SRRPGPRATPRPRPRQGAVRPPLRQPRLPPPPPPPRLSEIPALAGPAALLRGQRDARRGAGPDRGGHAPEQLRDVYLPLAPRRRALRAAPRQPRALLVGGGAGDHLPRRGARGAAGHAGAARARGRAAAARA